MQTIVARSFTSDRWTLIITPFVVDNEEVEVESEHFEIKRKGIVDDCSAQIT